MSAYRTAHGAYPTAHGGTQRQELRWWLRVYDSRWWRAVTSGQSHPLLHSLLLALVVRNRLNPEILLFQHSCLWRIAQPPVVHKTCTACRMAIRVIYCVQQLHWCWALQHSCLWRWPVVSARVTRSRSSVDVHVTWILWTLSSDCKEYHFCDQTFYSDQLHVWYRHGLQSQQRNDPIRFVHVSRSCKFSQTATSQVSLMFKSVIKKKSMILCTIFSSHVLSWSCLLQLAHIVPLKS